LVLKGQIPDFAQLGRIAAVTERNNKGLQPELRDDMALPDVYVGRLLTFVAEEVETEAVDHE
jgi:hypothetical protein